MLLVVSAATATPAAAQRTVDEPAAIRAELQRTADGWNAGNLDAYLASYDDSIVSRGRDGFVRGKAAAAEVMKNGFWKTGKPLQKLRYENLDIRMLGRDHALMTGQFVLSGAERPEQTGWFTTVWKKTPAGWRMIHDHS